MPWPEHTAQDSSLPQFDLPYVEHFDARRVAQEERDPLCVAHA